MPDLIGIGSINVDLIVGAAAAGAVDLGDPRLGLTPADVGHEREATPDDIERALGYLSGFDPVISPGGSALNVVAGVAATGAPVAVGHVGVRGTEEPPGTALAAWLRRLDIDDALIATVDGPPGLCLSITRDGQRTLLTTSGVNDRLGRHLVEHRDRVIDHLSGAGLVHVTSLVGLDDLAPLIDVLDGVGDRAGAPADGGPRLSCDPGAIWTAPGRSPAADEVLARCHQLLVNRREFEALGGNRSGAGPVFERFPAVELVVVKAADRVEIHRSEPIGGGPTVTVHPNPRILEPQAIVDDTGSGDAFAAGFLIGQLVAGLDEAAGVELGMDLARAKLGFPGVTGIDGYADVWQRFAHGTGFAPR